MLALLAHLGPFKASVMLDSVFSLNTCKMEITHPLPHLPNGGNRSDEYVRILKQELYQSELITRGLHPHFNAEWAEPSRQENALFFQLVGTLGGTPE